MLNVSKMHDIEKEEVSNFSSNETIYYIVIKVFNCQKNNKYFKFYLSKNLMVERIIGLIEIFDRIMMFFYCCIIYILFTSKSTFKIMDLTGIQGGIHLSFRNCAFLYY